ncbi:glycosyltransferase [Candidatus Woesearchaeota archaeon]|nr:glycosyltransferase [Candidatus Woesearchaeota archaeon]
MSQLITIVIPDLEIGGAERLSINLANHWVTEGYTVEFVVMRRQGELINLLSKGINIVDLNVDRIYKVVFPLVKYLRKKRPKIILSFMWPLTSISVVAWLIAKRQGKLFLSDHIQLSHASVHELFISPLLVKIIIKLTYPFATGAIAVSHGVKKDIKKLGALPDSLIKVIYNPAATRISLSRSPEDVQQKLWGDKFKHHILSVGRLKVQKDHELLLRSFSLIPASYNAKLVILGDGDLYGHLMNLVQELGLEERVSIPGFTIDTSPWYRSADLFVLSSRWEGFGNVIVEALECGVPVVSTDCPSGPAEILDNGRYGTLVPVGEIEELALAMIKSLDNIHDHVALIDRARDFSVPKISKQYLDYFFN